jgi:hypothetical protein
MIDTDKIKFILGKETSEYLQILVDNFAYPDSTDFWDGNWINTRIKIKVGGFIGDYDAQLRNVDFFDFMDIPAILCHSYRAYCATSNSYNFLTKFIH